MAKKNLTIEEKLEEAIVKDVPYEVPGNWVWSYLGSLSEFIRGVSYKKGDESDESSNTCLINRGGNIQSGRIVSCDDNVYISQELVKEKQLLKKGDVLIVGSTGSSKLIGKAALIEEDNNKMSFGAFVINVRPDNIINYKYFGYYFLSNLYINSIRGSAVGVNINNINNKQLDALKFPIPPLKEQQRIVERIESLFEKLDKANELIEEARDEFEKRKTAILEKAFRGELTEKWREENNISFQWSKYKFKGFILAIQAGKNFKCTERPANIDEVGLVKISAVTWGEFDQYENKVVEDKDKINEKYFIKKGDYLISRANTLELVGSSVIVKNIDQTLMLSDKVWRVEFDNKIVSKELINYYVKSIKGREEIESRATGSQLSMRNISQDSFKDIDIILPEIREQKEIVRVLDKLLEEEHKIQELIQLEEQIELIKKSILAKVFRGELGTNCEEDESALELLKEILSRE